MQLLIIIILFLNLTNQAMSDENKYEKAILAGGCFWCIESDFDKLEGVISTISGYTGGTEENPTYKEVSAGHTSHYEAVEIIYDTIVI